MIGTYLSAFFIYLFGIFNLIGVKQSLLFDQIQFFVIGLAVFAGVKKIGRNFFCGNSRFFYWVSVIFLFLVLFLGESVRGSKRWLNLFFFNVQPSEFFKIFFIIYLAQSLAGKKYAVNPRLKFFDILIHFLLPALLIFKQPDLGTAIVLSSIFLSMVFFSDLPKKYLINLALSLLVFFPVGWFFLHPYQRVRLLSFLNPDLDAQGAAYNMIQSIITIGSGGFFGKGLGLGTQSRLFFLPENYTDFAFASLVEQFGFFGGTIVIGLFLFFSLTILNKIWGKMSLNLRSGHFDNEKEAAEFYYLIGFFSYLICQIFVNLGMNMGIMPITGITLPLISYGGSSLVSLMLALALVP